MLCGGMAHPASLIEKILALLKTDYPEGRYTYKLEKAIPGTRMLPDIQVTDTSGNICCAVEIGYTRPEKLTAYRHRLHIPDVRWYDKAGELHADVQERVVKVAIENQPLTNFVSYRIHDIVECHSEDCESEIVAEWNYQVAQIETTMTEREADDLEMEISEFLAEETILFVVTDYVRIWFCLFCDKCGNTELVSEDYSIDVWAVAEDLRELSPREFARSWGSRLWQGDWNTAKNFLQEFGIEVRYDDGDYLERAAKRNLDLALTSIQARVMESV